MDYKQNSYALAFLFSIQLLLLTSCGGGSNSESNTENSNNTPIANAGSDQTAFINDRVTADGSASYDPDGDPLTYTWYYVSAPVTLSEINANNLNSPEPYFYPTEPGTYRFALEVSDGSLTSNLDYVNLTVRNRKPTAQAGIDQQVSINESVTLDGSSSTDTDNHLLTYSWIVNTTPWGIPLELQSPNSAQVDFTPPMGGSYSFLLTVDDGYDVDTDDVTIQVVEPFKISPTTVEIEPNSTISSADEVSFNTSITGQLSSVYDVDTFRLLTLDPGVIEIEINTDSPLNGLNDYFEIWIATVQNSGIARFVASRGIYNIRVEGEQSHVVYVKAGRSYDSGNYNITPAYSTESNIDGELENNDDISRANLLHFDTPTYGQLFYDTDQDWYSVQLNAGQSISVKLETASPFSAINTFTLTILDSSQNVLLNRGVLDIGDRVSPSFFSPSSSGQYYVRITSSNSYSSEMYKLSISNN
ncbi:MAG: PKD domain-containing protein [Candidatus Thiodiazotropha taylori]